MLKDIFPIFQEIVKDSDYLNSWAILDKLSELNENNLGKTYQDYLDGYFYSKKWVNQGRTKDDLCVEWPLLYLEFKTSEIPAEDIGSAGCINHTFFLTVADNIAEGDGKKSWTNVDFDNLEALQWALNRFFEYRQYQITLPDLSTQTIWGHSENLDARILASTITAYKDLGCPMFANLRSQAIQIFTADQGVDDLRMKASQFLIEL